jgi:hypothetical protein
MTAWLKMADWWLAVILNVTGMQLPAAVRFQQGQYFRQLQLSFFCTLVWSSPMHSLDASAFLYLYVANWLMEKIPIHLRVNEPCIINNSSILPVIKEKS